MRYTKAALHTSDGSAVVSLKGGGMNVVKKKEVKDPRGNALMGVTGPTPGKSTFRSHIYSGVGAARLYAEASRDAGDFANAEKQTEKDHDSVDKVAVMVLDKMYADQAIVEDHKARGEPVPASAGVGGEGELRI
jgi:hypothetical protein